MRRLPITSIEANQLQVNLFPYGLGNDTYMVRYRIDGKEPESQRLMIVD
ncbi:hypothetical protein [Persicobacter diffluens]|uniref:Uncharacterized protein n=1 Tax=Persicobacter diffluens TaxID=981 RepID=A0AAN4VYE4_9BACT|nr:hypothetical protein PEDI_16470 [Persicobacter diffluens]